VGGFYKAKFFYDLGGFVGFCLFWVVLMSFATKALRHEGFGLLVFPGLSRVLIRHKAWVYCFYCLQKGAGSLFLPFVSSSY